MQTKFYEICSNEASPFACDGECELVVGNIDVTKIEISPNDAGLSFMSTPMPKDPLETAVKV
jgi:hypothetical protein